MHPRCRVDRPAPSAGSIGPPGVDHPGQEMPAAAWRGRIGSGFDPA